MSVMREGINILENMTRDAEGLFFCPRGWQLWPPTPASHLSVLRSPPGLRPEALLTGSHPLGAE